MIYQVMKILPLLTLQLLSMSIMLPFLLLIATSVSDACSNTSLEAVESSSIVDDNDLIQPACMKMIVMSILRILKAGLIIT